MPTSLTLADLTPGDRVTYVGPGGGFGERGTVRKIDRQMDEVGVELDGDDFYSWYDPNELREEDE